MSGSLMDSRFSDIGVNGWTPVLLELEAMKALEGSSFRYIG